MALSIVATAAIAGAVFAYISIYHYEQDAAALLPPPSPEEMATGTPAAAIDTSGWKTYANSASGFSFRYPSGWQRTGSLTAADPHVSFGNPLSGTTTYRVSVSVYGNPQDLSAADYVSMMLASDTAEDVRSGAASGTAPRVTPQFSRRFALTVAGGPAYELYGVFEFDHQGEQIYIQHGMHMILFDFPVSEANPNIADPVANNILVHAMMDTLRLSTGTS